MVQPRSAPGDPYLPENLHVENGELRITTTSGSQYRVPGQTTGSVNSLDNGLGVGIDPGTHALRIQTTIIAPPNGSGKGQQAGIWFGPDEDNYVKLVVLSASASKVKVQLSVEQGGGNAGDPAQAPPGLRTRRPSPPGDRRRAHPDPRSRDGSGGRFLPDRQRRRAGVARPGALSFPASFFSNQAIGTPSRSDDDRGRVRDPPQRGEPAAVSVRGLLHRRRHRPHGARGPHGRVGDRRRRAGLPGLERQQRVRSRRLQRVPVDRPAGPHQRSAQRRHPLQASSYLDTTAVNGTQYHYVVTAVDTSTNDRRRRRRYRDPERPGLRAAGAPRRAWWRPPATRRSRWIGRQLGVRPRRLSRLSRHLVPGLDAGSGERVAPRVVLVRGHRAAGHGTTTTTSSRRSTPARTSRRPRRRPTRPPRCRSGRSRSTSRAPARPSRPGTCGLRPGVRPPNPGEPGQRAHLRVGRARHDTPRPVGRGHDPRERSRSEQGRGPALRHFVHMQADDIAGSFNGTKLPVVGVAMPNGTYTVTVAVGTRRGADPSRISSTSRATPRSTASVPTGARVTYPNQHRDGERARAGQPPHDRRLRWANTKIDFVDIVPDTAGRAPRPRALTLEDGATGVSLATSASPDRELGERRLGRRPRTMDDTTVRLVRTATAPRSLPTSTPAAGATPSCCSRSASSTPTPATPSP